MWLKASPVWATEKTMTINEFKAWLEGFSEAMGSSPNVGQWRKIQERLVGVHGGCVCKHDRWWPSWYTYTYEPGVDWNTTTTLKFDTSDSNTNWGYCTAANQIGKQEATYLARTDS